MPALVCSGHASPGVPLSSQSLNHRLDRTMIVPLDFGPHDDVVYERAPLVKVLCQIRFPEVLSLLSRAGVAGFQSGLREDYPEFEAKRTGSVEVLEDGIGVETSAPIWLLRDQQKAWTVGLAVDFVSLETSAYTHIEDFLSRFSLVLDVLRATIRPADSIRIGFRKVNHITAPDQLDTGSLKGIVRREMLGPLAADSFPAPISGFASQLTFREDDSNSLVVRYGIERRDEADDMRYILDLDYFTDHPQRIEGADPLLNILRHFSDGATNFFTWALEPEYLASLGPNRRADSGGSS